MKIWSLLALRISLGGLLGFWGIDKLVNTAHSIHVSDHFYFGVLSSPIVMYVVGTGQILLSILIILGLYKKYTYPLQTIILGIGALAVWKSIIDPWGWYLEGTNVLFYPSLIIFAASWVLLAFKDQDTLVLRAGR